MFSTSSLDKSCVNSDSCSPGRNNINAPNRFSVGISPPGGENQQIRIQLAVHKYNGTGSGAFNNRCSLTSPVRHSLLKNSLKVRNYDGESEGTSKTEKRNWNQYEGVGAFPTVHLKKSAVRYRPIKRFHDVKIPYPELPVNRFLTHLPEVCPDLKSSTRSVLDVLEDLSGNKIHSKDDSGSCKPKQKGLGGDYFLNSNALYKPLFVQKPKSNTVLTRDSTTQTLSPVSIETPTSHNNSSYVKNAASDPKVELRRKLAKQNNEIFASLSSSISSAFSLKRKIDKVLPNKEDGLLSNGSAKKKSKTTADHSHDFSENGISKSIVTSRKNSSESVELNRKSKPVETNPISPNKDRLTTIFLDTRNTSPKVQMFQKNASTEIKVVEKTVGETSNGLSEPEDKRENSIGNANTAEKKENENGQNLGSFTFPQKSLSTNADKTEAEKINKSANFVTNKEDTSVKDGVKLPSSGFQFGVNTADATSFNSSKIPTGNVSGSSESFKEVNGNDSKKDSDNKELNKSFTSGNLVDKPNFGGFKFGASESGPITIPSPKETQNSSFTDTNSNTSLVASVGNSITANSKPQFSFGATPSVALPTVQTSTVQFGATIDQSTFTSPGKTTFTFGQNTLAGSQNSDNVNIEAKSKTSTESPSVSAAGTVTTTQIVQPITFTFGQKSTATSANDGAKQCVVNPVNQLNQPSVAVNFGAELNKSSPSSTPSSGTLFTFGKKETSVTSPAVSAPAVQEQTKSFPFIFGQKTYPDANKTETGEKSGNLFSSEPKPIPQSTTQNSAISTVTTQMSQTFAQTVPSATIAPQATFSQTTTNFTGNLLTSTPTTKFNQTTTSFGSDKPLSFESPVNGFGKTSTQTTSGFTTSISNTPAFSFTGSTIPQSTSTFGISSVTQSTPTFGSTSTTQSVSGFGNTTTTQSTSTFVFGVSSTTQSTPTFGASTASQSTPSFGSSSAAQPTSVFGTTTTQATSPFGVSSQSSSVFGTNSNTPATSVFTSTSGFGFSSSKPGTMFGAPTSTQSTLRFGAPQVTQSNATFGVSPAFSSSSSQPSTVFGSPATISTPGFPASQSFDHRPISSLAQTPSIFTQNPVSTQNAFSSGVTFPPTQNNIFPPKPAETSPFGQNKIQTSGFDSTSQRFGTQNKFSFGMCTGNATAFTTSPPTTTVAPVFSFSGSTSGNAFTFGSSSTGVNNQTPFAFKSPTNEPFKFGAAPTTVTSSTTTSTSAQPVPTATFSFGNQKPPFSFGSSQPSTSSPAFNFGSASASTPSPSVFNFGASTPNINFGQSASPSGSFSVPGTFNIGSGSSQSRPRASLRPRRRP